MNGIGLQRVGDGLYFYAITRRGAGPVYFGWDGFQKALAEYVMEERAGWFEALKQFVAIANLRASDVGLPHNWKFEADDGTNAVRAMDPKGVVLVEDCPSLTDAVRAAREAVEARRQPTPR